MARMPADAFEDRARRANRLVLPHLRVDAVVADERITEYEDLAGIRWVGQRFFVAGHAREKYRLAFHDAGRSDSVARIVAAISKDELCGWHQPPTRVKAADRPSPRKSPSRIKISPPTTASAGLTLNVMPANGVT